MEFFKRLFGVEPQSDESHEATRNQQKEEDAYQKLMARRRNAQDVIERHDAHYDPGVMEEGIQAAKKEQEDLIAAREAVKEESDQSKAA